MQTTQILPGKQRPLFTFCCSLLPVAAAGFDDLARRAAAQKTRVALHQAKLQDLAAAAADLQRIHAVDVACKLAELGRANGALEGRAIRLLKAAQLLKNKGLPPTKEEEAMRSKIEDIFLALTKTHSLREASLELAGQQQPRQPLRAAGFSALGASIAAQNSSLSRLLAALRADSERICAVERGCQQ